MSKLIKKFQEPDGAIELQVTLEQNDKKDSPLIDERYWNFYNAWNKLDANLSSVASEYSDLDWEKIYNSKDKNNYGDYNKIYDPETKLYKEDHLKTITEQFTDLYGDDNNLGIKIPDKYPEDLKKVVSFFDYWYGSPTTLAIYLQNQKEIAQGIPLLMHNIHDIYGGYNKRYNTKDGVLQRNLDLAATDTKYRAKMMNKGLQAFQYRDSINDNLKQDNPDLNPEQTRNLIQSSIQRAVDNTVFKVNDKEKGFLYIPESYKDLKRQVKDAYTYWDPHHYNGGSVGYAVFSDRPELKEQFKLSIPNLAGYKSYLDFLDNIMHEFGHMVQFTNNPGLLNYKFAVDYKDADGKTQKRPTALGESFTSKSDTTAMADEKKLEEISNKYGFGLGTDIDGKSNVYWDSGKELRLRLLDVRYQLWKKGLIDPTKRNITAEDLKKFREAIGDSYQLNDKFLNRYPDEMLMEMFNTVASTTPSFNTSGVKRKYSYGNNTAFVKEGSKLIPKHQGGTNGSGIKRLDIESLKRDPEYVNNYNWRINDANIEALLDSLIGRNAGYPQRLATLAMVIPENGGNTTAHGNGAYGLVGWRGDRAVNLPADFAGQAHKLMVELFANPTGKDWTHGGKGTGVMTGREMYELFNETPNTSQATKAIMKGYVRPESSEHQKRIDFTQLLKRHMK